MDGCARGYLKSASYGKVSKTSPQKLTFTANFTQKYRHFDIMPERDSMRQDILNSVIRRTESIMMEHRDSDGANPLYEDPRDVIGKGSGDKPPKPPRKRNIQGLAVTSPRSTKEGRSLLKDQKRKLTKKYEGLITALMDKCEEQVVVISEKESHIMKLKEKLKSVLGYNRLFADENDRLRAEHATLVSYTEDCKRALKEQQEIGLEVERKCKRLEEKVKQYEMPDREPPEPSSAIPLVEVCMSCSSRQILLQQAREHAARLQRDMLGLKDVLYRLNVQLSRYQQKLRSSVPSLATEVRGDAPGDKYDGFDSLITASLGRKQGEDAARGEEGPPPASGREEPAARAADLAGLLSAQALAPLFDAYQENLQEKDNLILDYEKQFENMNRRSKQIVADNKCLNERVGAMEEELARVRQSCKKLALEKETADIEKVTLAERAEKAESKLKEVYELYEDKMAAMRRDYETVHREYYAVKSALAAAGGRGACGGAPRTVPAELHEQRLEHCKRLLEELKQQHGAESARLAGQLAAARGDLAAALRNAKLYRKAAVVFRQRARAAAARAARVTRAARAACGRRRGAAGAGGVGGAGGGDEQLRRALDALEKIKLEIKAVRRGAHGSLLELERRMVQQEAAARRQLARKDHIISSLMHKVADVEEVRLSQTNVHRLQGIVSDSSERSGTPDQRDPKPSARPVPAAGGYLQQREARRNTKT